MASVGSHQNVLWKVSNQRLSHSHVNGGDELEIAGQLRQEIGRQLARACRPCRPLHSALYSGRASWVSSWQRSENCCLYND